MTLTVNMSEDTYNYYKGYDLSNVIDILLDMYDITQLPDIEKTEKLTKQVKVFVQNENYIAMRSVYGARSRRMSLARLLVFGKEMDVKQFGRFKELHAAKSQLSPETEALSELKTAYKHLLMANSLTSSSVLKDFCEVLSGYITEKEIKLKGEV